MKYRNIDYGRVFAGTDDFGLQDAIEHGARADKKLSYQEEKALRQEKKQEISFRNQRKNKRNNFQEVE